MRQAMPGIQAYHGDEKPGKPLPAYDQPGTWVTLQTGDMGDSRAKRDRFGFEYTRPSRRWECGNRACDFQALWKGWEACFWLSMLSTGAAFPPPSGRPPRPLSPRPRALRLEQMRSPVEPAQQDGSVVHLKEILLGLQQTHRLPCQNLA